jgi:hypothetical protein
MKAEPAINQTAFNCPHCGAYTSQEWFALSARLLGQDKTPTLWQKATLEGIREDEEMDEQQKREIIGWVEPLVAGFPSISERSSDPVYNSRTVENIHLSKCYVCGNVTVWLHDRPIYPARKIGPLPNEDLSQQIKAGFEEARSVIGESPRAAAALLRLCVQMLCKQLGQRGENINDDIAALVKTGLNPTVQQSLDIVRVIGNEAVHPGVIDLNDNRDMALMLFDLVNAIAEQMITHPKKVNAMFQRLPEDKRKQIERRDAKKP